MSDRIEIQGKTVEAAVSEALLQMGARRDEVEIKVLEEPKSGFMGFLGGRAARVLVRKKRSGRGGGRGRDHRVEDNDYQAHDLGRGRGRSRGGSRKSSSGEAPSERSDSRQASRQNSRRPENEGKSGSRRGSRGRGSRGRGRSQEASGRDQNQNRRPNQRQDQKPNQKPNQEQKQKPNQEQKQAQAQKPNRKQVPDRKPAARRGRGNDSRQDNRQQAPKERNQRNQSIQPRQNARDDSAPREETPIRPLRQEPVQTQAAPAAPAMREETKPSLPKKETTVAKPPKPRRSFGGLGSRIKERRAAAKAAEAPETTENSSPVNQGPSGADPAPAPRAMSAERPRRAAPERMSRDRRGSSYGSASRDDEVVLAGIKGVQYAKSIGSVTDEGLDEALTELTDALLARAGFPSRCETFPGEYRQIKVTTDEASAGMLIGRHGQTVEAVEHLVERMASNAIDARARINLDINNYRMRREELLVERVTEAAEKIRETGRSLHMEPMSGRERRIVHMEAAELGGLRTFTMDGSGGKHVVIALEQEDDQKADDQRTDDQRTDDQVAEPAVDRPDDGADELNNSET